MVALIVLVAAGGSGSVLTSTPAAAAVLAGTAVITVPGGTTPLHSGGSATLYGVALPQDASCPGDSAHKGYHVFSYLVPKGVSPATVTFTDLPQRGLGYFADGAYVGAVNTAENTGQIVGLPAEYSWSRLTPKLLFSGGDTTATWNGGIACADEKGVVTNYWNTEIVFKASHTDGAGFAWSVVTAPAASSGPWLWVGIVLLVVAVVLGGSAVEMRRRRRDESRHVDR